jgi:hypothetical protein
MNYKEATYKEKEAFKKTLTTSQRTKLRRMENEHKEQIQPINYASHARMEEIRREAWVTLKVSERVKELEEATNPKIDSLNEQIQELAKQLEQVREELYEARSKIQTEPYQVAYDDPQVLAMNSIWHKTKEAQEAQLQRLIDGFLEKALV